ncbi:MAG: 2-oxoacid:ferredoxin oxidoreductase subunit alpha [Herbinix sp.]|jgi:2-oxoglutarate ferredoxin oxidoreductase subunit alpha|nr:2-oxoacid:ferredoxin oxidoreductase subunit alpha [Herbinix sp.]
MYNILIGGAAGQGIDTTVDILEKLLKRSGYFIYTTRDFMSRVRGGHNFSILRFGTERITSHSEQLDGIIALNEETILLHKNQLNKDGFILCDSSLKIEDTQIIKLSMDALAKEMGNQRVAGSIAVGAILKLFGEKLDFVNEIMKTSVKEQYLEMNLKAIQVGFDLVEARFVHKEGAFKNWMMLSGSKALGLGAIAAGLKFYSAYPMSPSTAVMEYLASKSKEVQIVVEQAEDEIAAINMAIGASYAGARAMTGTSGGGFCLKVEALGLAGIAEVPLVVVDVQRPGPATGLPTRTEQSDLKFVISAAQGEFPRMVIALRNHEDAFYQTIRAFHMAEKYQIPVIILSDQYLGDSTACVEPYDLNNIQVMEPAKASDIDTQGEYLRYRLTEDGISPRLIPGKSNHFVTADSDEHTERGWITESADVRVLMMDKRMKKLEKLEEELQEPDFLGSEACDTLILGWGSTYGPIAEAIKVLEAKEKGKYGALIFGDVYPLPRKLLEKKAATAKNIINIEQNATGQLAGLIREVTGIQCTSSILKYDGRQISGEEIVQKLLKGGQN